MKKKSLMLTAFLLSVVLVVSLVSAFGMTGYVVKEKTGESDLRINNLNIVEDNEGKDVAKIEFSSGKEEIKKIGDEVIDSKGSKYTISDIGRSWFLGPKKAEFELVRCASAGEVSSNPSLGPENDPDRECCGDLVEISGGMEYAPNQPTADEDGCIMMVGSGIICSDCGNGICEEWENKCNCPEDCGGNEPEPTNCGCIGEETGTVYQCGDTVNESCTMNCDLNSNGTCFTVGADGITLDGNNHSITGDWPTNSQTLNVGIYLENRMNTVLKNFKIYNFMSGIFLNESSNNNLTSNFFENNGPGIFLYLSDNTFIDSNVFENSGDGGIELLASSNNKLIKNVINNSDEGITLSWEEGVSSNDNLVILNTLTNNGAGIKSYRSSNNIIKKNVVKDNAYHGIELYYYSHDNELIENQACNNSYEEDIRIQNDSTGNTGYNNTCNTTQNWNDTGTTGCSFSCDQIAPGCVDSDGGLNYYEKGNVEWEEQIHNDFCGGCLYSASSCPNTLHEWVCEGGSGSMETYNCSTEGLICQDGACVEANPWKRFANSFSKIFK